MILYIDTTHGHYIEIAVKDNEKIIAQKKFLSKYTQAEKLLPAMDKMLNQSKIKITDLRGIRVNNKGGSFTALRIGVATANALGYALGVPVKEFIARQGIKKKAVKAFNKFNIIEPIYNKEPNITLSNN